MKVLETAVGAIFASTRFSLVRISIRDLVADGKSLVRTSGVGGGGQNLILIIGKSKRGLSKRGLGPKGANWAQKSPFGETSAVPRGCEVRRNRSR